MTAEELSNEFWAWLNANGADRTLDTTTAEFARFVVEVVIPRIEAETAKRVGLRHSPALAGNTNNPRKS